MMDAIKKNSVPLGLIGAGAGWLIVGALRGNGGSSTKTPATHEAAPNPVVEQVRSAAGAVGDQATRAGESVQAAYASYPLTSGLAAAAAGLALGLAVPMGGGERSVMAVARQKLIEGVKGAAKGSAKQVARGTKEIAARASRRR